ncbi:MAG: HNH endonuclease [Mycoplasmataceae bacterium]|nr:HNH endonuclease [Mycoplasmataceae bacterium]
MKNYYIPYLNYITVNLKNNKTFEVNITFKSGSKKLKDHPKYEFLNNRVGQQLFKQQLIKVQKKSLFDSYKSSSMFEAAHIKPFSKCEENEKYDTSNGLLLEPDIHRLYDKNLINFKITGDKRIEILFSESISDYDKELLLNRLGSKITSHKIENMDEKMQKYLLERSI